ncbi:hypothetical protein AB0M47_02450 [Hamadaea sp. NPDC051192]|uniref:hypothetical protein n=1 Tax=Hamadaea sp. NPDC051192 TaxID=3154940 RepID=UPI0034353983
MKLTRVLAVLAMVFAGLAGPATAQATEPAPGGTPDPATLSYICALFAGEYHETDPLTYACRIGDEEILCAVARDEAGKDPGGKDAEEPPAVRCGYEVSARMWPSPLRDRCDMAGGTWSQDPRAVIGACEFKDIRVFVLCPDEPWPSDSTVCSIGSDQPMSVVEPEPSRSPDV